MSNKIIDSLLNGNLVAKGSVAFDNTQACYLVEYADGSVGVYSVIPKITFYNYAHYELKDGAVVQSVHKPKNFFLDKSINDFFNSIITNNFMIASNADSKLSTLTALDGKYIVNLYYYNPRAQVTLETIDMSVWAITAEQKTQWKKATSYFTTVSNKSKVMTDTNTLVKSITTFIQNLILTKQKSRTNNWTVSGMLVLEIQQALTDEATILANYAALKSEIASFNMGTAPSLSDIISTGLNTTSWTLGRLVDLNVSPFLYLYPKGANMPAIVAPAIAPTDPSVQVNTTATVNTDTSATTPPAAASTPETTPAPTTTPAASTTETNTPTATITPSSTETPAATPVTSDDAKTSTNASITTPVASPTAETETPAPATDSEKKTS